MKSFFVFLILLIFHTASGQSVIIGSPDDFLLRSLQVSGKLIPDFSFTSRPYTKASFEKNDSVIIQNTRIVSDIKKVFDGKSKFYFLPFVWQQQFNSHHPFGWNDGAMIPAKGYQSLFRAGAYAQYGFLSIQLQPEFLYAQNEQFSQSSGYGGTTSGNFSKPYLGQSSLRINLKSVSFGISSENIWWGPGMYSSLLMSNNAPGFLHATFNSIRPVKTRIGNFEWQLLGGQLTNDNKLLSQNVNLKNLPSQLSAEKRYLNGLSITWKPKWVKGLFIGMNRVFQVYRKDQSITTGFVDTYLPVLGGIFKKTLSGGSELTEDAKKRDQLISLFTRWLFPKSKAECYFEYGWNDHSYNSRDFAMSPTHSAAYLVGLKKIFPISSGKTSFVDFGMEYTHMAQSPDYMVREAGNWYVHNEILEGYTHNGQILGAGSGLGNNVLTLNLNYYKGRQMIGLRFDKIQNDPLESYHPYRWDDISIGVTARREIGFFFMTGKLNMVNSQNYAWENTNKLNVYASLSISYPFR